MKQRKSSRLNYALRVVETFPDLGLLGTYAYDLNLKN